MAANFFFDPEVYASRRNRLISLFPDKPILLIGNEESGVNFADNWYPFRQDSTFLYYIGINLPSMAAIIDPKEGTTTLFGDDASIEMVIWTGPQTSIAELAAKAGITNVRPYHELENALKTTPAYLPPYRPEHELKLNQWLGIDVIEPSIDLIKAIESQRSIKSPEEIEQLDQAVTLSGKMHEKIVKNTMAGMHEYQLVSMASQFAWDHGVRWAYPPIMTKHGETLHNHYYGNKLEAGDMVLYDGGVEMPSGYCGDLTRTFPVSSSFSSIQKEIYQIVLSAYEKAKTLSQPDVFYRDVHLKSSLQLIEGLIELGWMKGNAEDALNEGAHTLFFQHGLGHLMGLDVHDMENFGEQYIGYNDEITKSTAFGLKSLRLGKKLKSGYVITIEPGIYVIPALVDKFEGEEKHADFINYAEIRNHIDFGGIRIEDDFLITDTGSRQLGEAFTVQADEIEELRKN